MTSSPLLSIVIAALASTAPCGRCLGETDRFEQDRTALPLPAGVQSAEHELAGGQAHEYRFGLDAGLYARVSVAQRSINVAVTVFKPDGTPIVETDATGIGESETASFITEASGVYRARIRAPDTTAPGGVYGITLDGVQAATGRHRNLVAASRAFSEAMAMYYQQTADLTRQAIQKLEASLDDWRAAADGAGEARALSLIGRLSIDLGDKQKALESTANALPVARAAGDRIAEAWALDFIGQANENFGDRRKALEYYREALPLRRSAADRAGEASTLNNLGMAYARLGEKQQALGYFEEAAVIYRDVHDRRREATLLGNIGVTYSELGTYQRALESHTRALAIHRALTNRTGEATSLNNIGAVYSSLGEYQKALDAYAAARSINRASGFTANEAVNLNNIAWVYATLGDPQQALTFYTEASQIFRASGDIYDLGFTLSNIGATHADLGDHRKALELHQEALPLRRSVGDRDGEAMTLSNIGNSYSKLGDGATALEYYTQALSIHRAAGNLRLTAGTLRNLGVLYRDSGEQQKARDSLQEALQVSRVIGDRNGEGATLGEMARLDLDQGRVADARRYTEEALAAYESLRISVTSPKLRASFFASVRKVHELGVNVLMRMHDGRPSDGFDRAALLATERARARSLLELLAESHADVREGIQPALLERERGLRAALADRAEWQIRLRAGTHTEEQATAAAREIDALTTEYEQIQSRIRETSPRYAALTMPVPLSVAEIQRDVLDADTVLLEYALGQDSSYVFAVTRASLSSHELPKRATIEAAAGQVYDLLSARNRIVAHETPQQKNARVRRADAEYPAAALALSRMLLGPIASEIKARRLLIVAEGLLQFVPFSALPDPSAEGRGTGAQPLLVEHEVVAAPSASVLALLRRDTAGRLPPEKMLAVFADPVFDRGDGRITPRGRVASPDPAGALTTQEVLRSANESGLQRFVRLRFSRYEAQEIARVLPGTDKLVALDFAADRRTAMGPEIGRYRIVHFATHGLVNNQHPDLSGMVLSLVNQHGEPIDGFLRVYDIYNLKLGADLVVLSACQTALGKEIPGEGLIGLTRGFMYAGVPRIVASLWEIDDRATAELMKRFYEPMVTRGERPAAALRAAQIAMWKSKGWESPYYWAAFTLQGEWK